MVVSNPIMILIAALTCGLIPIVIYESIQWLKSVQYRYYEYSPLQEYGHAGWDVDWCQFDTLNAAQQFITDAQVNPDFVMHGLYESYNCD